MRKYIAAIVLASTLAVPAAKADIPANMAAQQAATVSVAASVGGWLFYAYVVVATAISNAASNGSTPAGNVNTIQ